jgi:propanol-preferring alcohol dehydrogenase
MRAMVLEQQEAVSESPLVLREIAEPQPATGEVRIRVSVCAVCRTDIRIAFRPK